MMSEERTIRLPQYVFEDNLSRFLSTLGRADETRSITLDFGAVTYYVPAAIVSLLAKVTAWLREKKQVYFLNHTNNAAFTYLQRIDFFSRVGMELPEDFSRHHPGRGFVPIEEVSPGAAMYNDKVANKLAACLVDTESPYDPVYQLAQYGIGEIIGNCRQHAEGSGFVSAQFAAKKNMARFGIADCGIGIRKSFEQYASPHWRSGMTDLEAIELALQPIVSSKTHLPAPPYGHVPNKGLGLSMIRSMIASSCGQLFIASGDGWWFQNGDNDPSSGTLQNNAVWQGTMVSVAFNRDQIADFQQLTKEAREQIRLTEEGDSDRFFT